MVHDADWREHATGYRYENIGKEQIRRRVGPVLDDTRVAGELCNMFRNKATDIFNQDIQIILWTILLL